ncbi:MAG: hypothetical protein JO305_05200 [Alphaproteobacteria bacterium]|nr:hypothetical protein [Alphaproteobacteria bacterium]
MRRYLIPFAVGLMLGMGSLPLWAETSQPCARSTPAPTAMTLVRLASIPHQRF